MNIADKIGVYLLLSLVFTLMGGVAGQVLPGTEATETIIVVLSLIGLVAIVGAIADMLIWILIRINQLIHKEYESRFIELIQIAKMAMYSVFYVSVYPFIAGEIYDDGGAIYANATECMVSFYGPLENMLGITNVLISVIIVIGAGLYYLNDTSGSKE